MSIYTDKRANVRLWDAIEHNVQSVLEDILERLDAEYDFDDLTPVKEVTEKIAEVLKGIGIEIPYIDENF